MNKETDMHPMNRKLWWLAFRRILCRVGLHRWQSKPSLNDGETFHRCSRCGEVHWAPEALRKATP